MLSESATASTTRTTDNDLTSKARIRNAAFELHATKGGANTTIREVAQTANVTHGLVVHHFGNKEGLRKAVQQHMVDLLHHALSTVPTNGTPAEVGKARDASVAQMYAEHPAYLRYLRRALVDPGHLDTELLDLLADFTLNQVHQLRAAGVATSSSSEQHQALAIIVRELAPQLLDPVIRQLWAHLTEETDAPMPDLDVKLSLDPPIA